jgi:hypothetical protein
VEDYQVRIGKMAVQPLRGNQNVLTILFVGSVQLSARKKKKKGSKDTDPMVKWIHERLLQDLISDWLDMQ